MEQKERKLVSALLVGFVTTVLVTGLDFIFRVMMERSSILVRTALDVVLLWLAMTFYCRIATERAMKHSRRNITVLVVAALDVALGEILLSALVQNGIGFTVGAFVLIRLALCFVLFSAGTYFLISISRKYGDVNDGMGEKDRDYAPKERYAESSVFQTRTTPQVKFWLDMNNQDKKNK